MIPDQMLTNIENEEKGSGNWNVLFQNGNV